MGDDFVEQPDGRMVAGPEILNLGKPSTGAGAARLLLLAGLLVAVMFGVLIGRGTAPTPEMTWQSLYGDRIQDGCLPQGLIVGVGPQAQTDQLTDGVERAVAAIHTMYPDARDIESHVTAVPQTARLRQANPQAGVVAYVTLERCLG